LSSNDQFDPHKFGEDLRDQIHREVGERMRRKLRRRGQGNHNSLVPGLILVLIGSAFLLDHMGILPVDHLWRLWPVILIVVGVIKVAESSNRTGGALMVLFGVFFLLTNLGILRISWQETWPILLIAVGVVMIFGRVFLPDLPTTPNSQPGTTGSSGSANTISATAMFGGVERRITTGSFTSGVVSATFGGVELDFRGADIEGEEAILQVEALFGGIEIVVPERWIVVYEGQSIFGAYNDETRMPLPDVPGAPPRKRLILRGQALFGGITVKN
jgi:predicted membrane protein